MFIYLIVNRVTGKYYVGQHRGNNLRKYLQTKLSDAFKHRGGRSYLFASMRKHGREAFTIHALLSDVETTRRTSSPSSAPRTRSTAITSVAAGRGSPAPTVLRQRPRSPKP